MTKRDFHTWLSNFRYSIADFGYYIDFNKVYKNVDSIKIELNILNSLIGSKNIESDFEKLIAKYPEILKCIPILLAVREYEIFAGENGDVKLYTFDKQINTVEEYKLFMKKTGLFDLLSNHIINNLYGNNTINLRKAVSIKFYHAVYAKIPILVCPDTYTGTLSKNLGIGFEVDLINNQTKEDLYKWYRALNFEMIDSNCNNFIYTSLQENKKLKKELIENLL